MGGKKERKGEKRESTLVITQIYADASSGADSISFSGAERPTATESSRPHS